MGKIPTNDLFDFMLSATKEMEEEYRRIKKRSALNSSVAGSEGEENWAKLFREWLPQDYHVKTKVALMNEKGQTSPEVDIVILYPFYPKGLIDKKVILTSGVIAAFECKFTLKSQHIKECFVKSIKIRDLDRPTIIKGYKDELYSPIIYGLLANSYVSTWKKSDPIEKIDSLIYEYDLKYVTNPKQQLDIICISDLAIWSSIKQPMTMIAKPGINNITWRHGPNTGYGLAVGSVLRSLSETTSAKQFTPIGGMLCRLLQKIAVVDERISSFSEYFSLTGLHPGNKFYLRAWPEDYFSKDARAQLDRLSTSQKNSFMMPS